MHALRNAAIIRIILLAIGVSIAYSALVTQAGPSWLHPFTLDTIQATFSPASPPRVAFIVGSFLLVLLGLLLGAARWSLLLRTQGIQIPTIYLLRSWIEGCFVGYFLPLSSGRDLYRFYDVGRASGAHPHSAVVILVERGLAFVSFVLLFVTLSPLAFWTLGLAPAKLRYGAVCGSLCMLAAVILLSLHRTNILRTIFSVIPLPDKAKGTLNQCLNALAPLSSAMLLIKAIALGLLGQLSLVLSITLLMGAFTEASWRQEVAASALHYQAPIVGLTTAGESVNNLIAQKLFAATQAFVHFTVLVWLVVRMIPAIAGALLLLVRALHQPSIDPLVTLTPPRLLLLDAATIADQRRQIANTLLASAAGGAIAGALTGLAESSWVYWRWAAGSPELRMFWWGPLVYALTFVWLGVGLGALAAFYALSSARQIHPGHALGAGLGAALAASLIAIGRFRFARDILLDHPLEKQQILLFLVAAVIVFLCCERLGASGLSRFHLKRGTSGVLAMTCLALLVAGGATFGHFAKHPERRPAFQATPGTQGPNIIFIIADTLRADYLDVYNENAAAQTPNLDAFARDAVLFKSSYAQASWTKPSFATLFTSLYPNMHGAIAKASVLPDDLDTFAELLARNGYYTQGFPNNRNLLPEYGLDQGFHGYTFLKPNLYFGATFSVEHLAIYQVLRRVRLSIQAPAMDVRHFYQPAERVTSVLLDWLDHKPSPAASPFLLYAHYMDPHDPYMLDIDANKGYGSILLSANPDAGRYREALTNAYTVEIAYLDRELGRFLDGLRERHLYDDSLILFTSDHGEELHEHGGWYHGPTVYEEMTHVPIIIKFPANRFAGIVNTDIARHIDIAPTLLTQAGIEPPSAMLGTALVNAQGQFANHGTTHSFAQSDFLGTIAESMRSAGAKLIRANENNPRGLAPVEFYDLQNDPGESSNLAHIGDTRESELGTLLDKTLTLMDAQSRR